MQRVNHKNHEKMGNMLKDSALSFIDNLRSLNSSKYFAGIMMLTLNIGSKYITLELSKTQEAYLKYTLVAKFYFLYIMDGYSRRCNIISIDCNIRGFSNILI